LTAKNSSAKATRPSSEVKAADKEAQERVTEKVHKVIDDKLRLSRRVKDIYKKDL